MSSREMSAKGKLTTAMPSRVQTAPRPGEVEDVARRVGVWNVGRIFRRGVCKEDSAVGRTMDSQELNGLGIKPDSTINELMPFNSLRPLFSHLVR